MCGLRHTLLDLTAGSTVQLSGSIYYVDKWQCLCVFEQYSNINIWPIAFQQPVCVGTHVSSYCCFSSLCNWWGVVVISYVCALYSILSSQLHQQGHLACPILSLGQLPAIYPLTRSLISWSSFSGSSSSPPYLQASSLCSLPAALCQVVVYQNCPSPEHPLWDICNEGCTHVSFFINQYPWTRSGPAAFQFAILFTPNLTSSTVMYTSSCTSVVLNSWSMPSSQDALSLWLTYSNQILPQKVLASVGSGSYIWPCPFVHLVFHRTASG